MDKLNLQELSSRDIEKLLLVPDIIEYNITEDSVRVTFEKQVKKKDPEDGITRNVKEYKTLTFMYRDKRDKWILTKMDKSSYR